MYKLTSFDVLRDKVVRDGCVAVLVSPGFGAGWSTWSRGDDVELLLFEPEVVAWVLDGKRGPAPDLEAKYGLDHYDGGAEDLVVEWVPLGARFRIDEYDGSETLVLESEQFWYTA